MQPVALIFFLFFGLVLFAMYILIRRRIGSTSLVAAAGIVGSMISMTLFSLAQGNILLLAVVVGIVVGGAFSVGALLVASYFTSSETRRHKLDPYTPPDQEQ